jgi:hypothetical protein
MTSPTPTSADAVAAPVRQRLAELLALEEAIASRLGAQRAAVAAHPSAAAAFARFRDLVTTQREAVRDLLQSSGGAADLAPVGAVDAPGRADTGGASAALREAYTLFNQAAIGYAVLDETAHVFFTGRTLGPTLQLAARHLRGYAGAAQEINQMIADVVAWELRRAGQRCVCPCPYCSLGVCWCIANSTERTNAAWRETAPTIPPGVVVAPNTRTPPGLDVQEADVVVAVNGVPVTSVKEVRAAAPSPTPGAPVRLSIRRPGSATAEVVASRS